MTCTFCCQYLSLNVALTLLRVLSALVAIQDQLFATLRSQSWMGRQRQLRPEKAAAVMLDNISAFQKFAK